MTISHPQAGDFAVVRTAGLAGLAIQAGNWLAHVRRGRMLGSWRWNHAGVIDIQDGQVVIIEATPHGVEVNPLSEYPEDAYLIYHDPSLTAADRIAIVASARTKVGTPYGWVDILVLALLSLGVTFGPLLTYAKSQKSMVCSQVVAWSFWDAGHPLPSLLDPWEVTPGDLADLILGQTV